MVLIRGVGTFRTHGYTGIIDGFSEKILPNWTFFYTHPGSVICEVGGRAVLYTEISNVISIPADRAVSYTVTSCDVAITVVGTHTHTDSTDVISESTRADVVANFNAGLCHIISISKGVQWALRDTTLGLVITPGE